MWRVLETLARRQRRLLHLRSPFSPMSESRSPPEEVKGTGRAEKEILVRESESVSDKESTLRFSSPKYVHVRGHLQEMPLQEGRKAVKGHHSRSSDVVRTSTTPASKRPGTIIVETDWNKQKGTSRQK